MERNLTNGSKLIEITGPAVFVGDTHGDFETSQKIVEKYLNKYKIVFLGDYIDRGPNSRKNIDYLLKIKEENSDKIFLLTGNHEAYPLLEFSPADFWTSLSEDKKEKYWKIFSNFPLAVSLGNIIAFHGALPEINNLKDFNKITLGDENWHRIIWGDFQDVEGGFLGINFIGRPQFGKNYFEKIMKKIDKKILIRSHDPSAPLTLYDKKCITIFSSCAYPIQKRIVMIDKPEVNCFEELKIETL